MNTLLVSPNQKGLVPGLVALLRDAVHGGASVGFLAPLSEVDARTYWESVFESISDGLCLWVVLDVDEVVASIQLDPSKRENGRHRAEIQKLFVRSSHRGKGISSMLMAVAEAEALKLGRTLLILDTQAGSKAEAVYRHLGWVPAGEIPDYAASPSGDFYPTVYFYKKLVPTAA